ncbi:MAG TPA: DUF5652 family protein [Candidatus Gracilibacteria bacterium]|nr:DUF5652 family protein [Candidatus Gracilibacteria bacterium]
MPNEITMQAYFQANMIWIVPLMIWSMVWDGIALWKAARNGSKRWFIVILLLNTAGILEILYIFIFGKKTESKKNGGKKK